MKKQGEILVNFFLAFNEAIMKIVHIVIWWSAFCDFFREKQSIMQKLTWVKS